jgi:ribosome-binding protein aMBF1 (putative translation factor)
MSAPSEANKRTLSSHGQTRSRSQAHKTKATFVTDTDIDKRVRLGIREEGWQQGEVAKETRAAEGVGDKFRLLGRVKTRMRV